MWLIHADVNVSMSHHSYTSLENNSSVLVCLGVTGNLRKDIAIRLDTTNGTAIGNFIALHFQLLNINFVCVCYYHSDGTDHIAS